MLGNDVVQQVHLAAQLVCPIDGVSIGNELDKTTWRIDFKPEATPAQRAAAQLVLDNFVPSPPQARITKWTAGGPSRQPDGFIQIAGGFVPVWK